MNYIKQLQQENKELKETIQATSEEATEIMRYLGRSKFAGMENNFVNAQEMHGRILNIRNLLNS